MMKTKLKTALLITAVFFIMALSFMGSATAFADEQPNEDIAAENEGNAEATEGNTINEWITVFNERWAPLIIAAAGGVSAVLIALFPVVKMYGSLKAARTAAGTAQKELKEYKDKDGVDVKALVEDAINKSMSYIRAALAEETEERQRLEVMIESLIKAAGIVWKEKGGVTELLNSSPTAQGFKRVLYENGKLKDALKDAKSEEADKIIASLHKEAEESA
jgi:hypothetical protein